MEIQAQVRDPAGDLERFEASPRWSLAKRIAFRFWFLYAGLYILATQLFYIILIPVVEIEPGAMRPARVLIEWVAKHVFRVSTEIVVTGSGSGDKIFDWTEAFCLLVLAGLGAAVWSVLGRRRPNHLALEKWLRLAVRIALGSSLISYGLDKVVPLQMSYPNLARLLEPYGQFSPMGVLWESIGASPAYEIFTGCAETLGGILVLLPRTQFLGALICLADVVEVFVLNMTYDVPVKLFSFHLILFSLYLLAPDWTRLRDFFLLGRGVAPSTPPPLFRSRRANRIASVVLAVYLIYLLGINLWSSASAWKEYGAGAPRSPLYGIWEIEEMSVNGALRPALAGDGERWRRIVFQFPGSAAVQRMDDSFLRFRSELTVTNRRLALTSSDDAKWTASFLVDRPSNDRLVLEGDMDHHRSRLELRRVDETKFLLPSRGFHWVQEYPFHR